MGASHSETRSIRRFNGAWFYILPLVGSWMLISFSATFLECPTFVNELLFPINRRTDNNDIHNSRTRSMYIPGAGFSGFFYTLGRLHSLHGNTTQYHDDEYYCFSAGCLALVASLMDVSLQSAVEVATGSRKKWMSGEIGRYDVVKNFVDGLLDYNQVASGGCDLMHSQAINSSLHDARFEDYDHMTNTSMIEMPCPQSKGGIRLRIRNLLKDNQTHKIQQHLSKIKIITSKWNNQNPIITQSIRTPSTVLELKEMLLQTTWIPFITGGTLGKLDASGDYHNDGAFAAMLFGWFREKNYWMTSTKADQYVLKLPWDAELLGNGLNIVLDYKKAVQFWKKGLMRG